MISSMKTKIPEILAPAGTYEALEAAVKAGCDAVYAGGSFFSARAYAGNFDEAEYLKAIDFCHLHGVKIYLTLNTLLKPDEIERVPAYVTPYYKAGLDAVLVQDMGVLKVLKENFPDLPIHASTQMSIASSYGALLAKELGLERIVPARELSLEEIRSIREKADIEIETFVHGAMCFAYSGKCLFSSFAGGRSGNRGRCAQPCRQCYELSYSGLGGPASNTAGRKRDAGKYPEVHEYIMSLKDLCTIRELPLLIDAGIDSFKIEGRMKNAYYVALAVSSYQEARDLYLELKEKEGAERFELLSPAAKQRYETFIGKRMDDLRDIYNRGGFYSGYYLTEKGREMAAFKRPNHIGLPVGRVEKIKAPKIAIRLEKELHKQDIIELIPVDKTGEEMQKDGIELTSSEDGKPGELIWLNGKNLKQIRPDMAVYRTRNNLLISEIEEAILKTEKTIDADCVIEAKIGKPLEIRLSSQIKGDVPDEAVVFGSEVTVAEKAPVSAEDLISKIKKSGGSGVRVGNVECRLDDLAFVRMSEFNALRREAMEMLKEKIVAGYHR